MTNTWRSEANQLEVFVFLSISGSKLIIWGQFNSGLSSYSIRSVYTVVTLTAHSYNNQSLAILYLRSSISRQCSLGLSRVGVQYISDKFSNWLETFHIFSSWQNLSKKSYSTYYTTSQNF